MATTMTNTITTTLNKTEKRDFARASETIRRGLDTFVQVGNALAVIRDHQLYREHHRTFEAYCLAEWDFKRSHAYRLIDAAHAAVSVGMSPKGDGPHHRPQTESQARPLTKLATREERTEAWATVIETAPKNEIGEPMITGRHVAAVVADMTSTKAAEGSAEITEEIPTATDGAADVDEQDQATVHDYLGQPVPDHVALAFHEEYKLDDIVGAIELTAKNITDLMNSPAGAHFDEKTATAALADLRRLVATARPFALCPRCEGATRTCGLCYRSGQVTESISLATAIHLAPTTEGQA